MKPKDKKPDTARLLREFEHARAARCQADQRARQATARYLKAESDLRAALGFAPGLLTSGSVVSPGSTVWTTAGGVQFNAKVS